TRCLSDWSSDVCSSDLVPFAPGGGSDFIARFIAQRLTGGLGQQVIVENKPGAGGMLGIEQGVKSPPDGYTLTLIASSYTVNPSIDRKSTRLNSSHLGIS